MDHAAESGFAVPDAPVVFPKYVSSFAGPISRLPCPRARSIGKWRSWPLSAGPPIRVTVDRGWEHVAGLTVGQDISERDLQRSGPAPQFGLAKSLPGFLSYGSGPGDP